VLTSWRCEAMQIMQMDYSRCVLNAPVSLWSDEVPLMVVSGGKAQVLDELLQAMPLRFPDPKERQPKRLTADPLHGRCFNH
jgi:hypothetical protein